MNDNNQKAAVAVVDHNLEESSKIKAFLEANGEFDVSTFTDLAEAQNFFESHEVYVAISDCRIAEISGLDFLKRLKEIQPESSRVLLTDCVDVSTALEAVNDAALFQYLEKPWEDEQLLLVVKSGAERSRLLRELRAKIEDLDSAHAALKTVQRRLLDAFL